MNEGNSLRADAKTFVADVKKIAPPSFRLQALDYINQLHFALILLTF